MAEEIAQLRQLQASMNAAFDGLLKATEESPENAGAIATAKEHIGKMAQMTLGTVLGPASSIMILSCQVGSRIDASDLDEKANISKHHAYAAVRVALDLKLFEIINKSTSLDEIVQKTDADPVILQRILRAVCAIGYLKQTALTQWDPTPLTHALNVPGSRDWLIASFDQRMVITGKFPEWLKKRGHKSTGAADDNVLTEVLGEPVWAWYSNHPKASAIFDSAMTFVESLPKEMKPPYPFSGDKDELRTDSDAVTLVDIGGGFGRSIKTIRADYPSVKGRFILQDLPKTISTIDAVQAKKDGFEPMVHDFFNPQTIKGAKYYHLRHVLHDWNDGPCIKILKATRAAMNETPDYSRLLIQEFVLPDVGCGFLEAMADLMMMQTCDGMERTESQWHALLGNTGFKIVKIWRAEQGTTAVIEAAIA
jgi:demethylsterigmatocystin 6-O-methyltransferase